MMNRTEIVEALAKAGVVEELVQNTALSPVLTDDLRDLSQMVYLALLEYDEEKIVDLWEHGQIRFFISRIVMNQYRSKNSRFYRLFRRPRERGVSLTGRDWKDGEP